MEANDAVKMEMSSAPASRPAARDPVGAGARMGEAMGAGVSVRLTGRFRFEPREGSHAAHAESVLDIGAVGAPAMEAGDLVGRPADGVDAAGADGLRVYGHIGGDSFPSGHVLT